MALRAVAIALGWEFYLLASGWFWVARLRLNPLEKLASSFAVGLFQAYLTAFVIYAWRLPSGLALATAVPGLYRLWQTGLDREIRRTLWSHQGLLWFWLLAQSLVVNFGGGFWYGDWYEHYERSLWFLRLLPPGAPLLGGYSITARPPLCNLAMSLPLGLLGAEFWRYQVVIVVLASLVYFPLACWARSPRQQCWLVLFLLTNLYVFRNVEYTWTKLPSAFFVLLGLVFYLRERPWLPATAACLTAGVVAHYMAAPYLLVVAGHAVLTSLTRPAWRVPVLQAALACGLVMAPWLLYSASHFGGTFTSNTTAAAFQHQSAGENVRMVSSNVINTLLPVQLRGGHPANLQPQLLHEPFWPRVRDELYLLYLHNGLLALGWGAWLTLALTRPRPNRLFWQLALPSFLLSVAVVPGIDPYGEAHIGLSPLILAGLAGAARLAERHYLVLAALALDGAATILHGALETLMPASIGGAAIQNWGLKGGLHLTYLADLLGRDPSARWPFILLFLASQAALWQEIRTSPRETAMHQKTPPEDPCPLSVPQS